MTFGAHWDARFMLMTDFVSTWSKDPDKKVGAVLVSPDRRQMSYGYNGLPKDFVHEQEYLADKRTKNLYSVHAELNAILNAKKDLTGWTMYISEAPCLECAKIIAQLNLARVVSHAIKPKSSWARSQRKGFILLDSLVNVTYLENDNGHIR